MIIPYSQIDLQLNRILNKFAETIDISDAQYEDAESRYQAVSRFLGECPTLSRYNPELYPQGSFLLGTVVKPILEGEEYDIDVVCQLDANKGIITQYDLKQLVGNRLKQPRYVDLLEPENRRSWTLKYEESTKFHLDILPAIPDEETRRYYSNDISFEAFGKSAINITDNTRRDHRSITSQWPTSNPKAYAEWFKQQMQEILLERTRMFAKAQNIDIGNVPVYKVKTPLQRAIQILKRHRDILFENIADKDDKPISIIITTLAAKAYGNQDNIYDALVSILRDMEKYITKDANGNDEILSPVDPRENFADKWLEYPQRKENFYSWLERAKIDFEKLINNKNVNELKKNLENSLGSREVRKTFSELNLDGRSRELPIIVRDETAIDFSPNEEFIQDLYEIDIQFELKIDCRVNQKGFRETLLRRLPILKQNKDLKFFISKNTAPKPYEVKWKVRNCGPEAVKRTIRGEILNDLGKEERREFSSFYGWHYVECYIIKNNKCVAMDRIDVPISGRLIDLSGEAK